MTSFGWKHKIGGGVVRKASQAFENEAKDEELDNEVTRGEVDWLTLAPKKRMISLEDARAKSRRLNDEAATLAEAERYWEAVKKWDEALLLVPNDSHVLEMKAQALMAVGEVFPAVHTAQQAVKADPTWWVARQTLGRAQLNMGEVRLAVSSFSTAVFLNPANKELWEEDLLWASSVRDRSKTVTNCKTGETSAPSASETIPSCRTDPAESDRERRRKTNPGCSGAKLFEDSDSDSDQAGTNRQDDSDEGDDARQTVLKVPPNYVHLRG